MENNIIILPDGYNGDAAKFYLSPILAEDGNTVKLQCAEPGKEYMSRSVHKADIEKYLSENK